MWWVQLATSTLPAAPLKAGRFAAAAAHAHVAWYACSRSVCIGRRAAGGSPASGHCVHTAITASSASSLCDCNFLSLLPRGVGYAGSTHVDGNPVHIFAAIDDTGTMIHYNLVPAQMVAMANTQTAVFSRGAGLHVWRAD